MIMAVSATSVKFGKSTNRMKSTKFWTMFTTSENYCYKRLYQKVGLLGNESFKCFQTYRVITFTWKKNEWKNEILYQIQARTVKIYVERVWRDFGVDHFKTCKA